MATKRSIKSTRQRVPDLRIQVANNAPVREDADYVLYWMIAFRRPDWNFSLDRAIEWARQLNKPLIVFEPLRIGYRWASDRLHRFVIDGMADNARWFAKQRVLYFPYVEPEEDADKGLLAAIAQRACVIVTDQYPAFFLPRMIRSAAKKLDVRVEQIDSNGLLPLRATDRVFSTAFSFRGFLQKNLREYLEQFPAADPFDGFRLPVLDELPKAITKRWPAASTALLAGKSDALKTFDIDHNVSPVPYSGGATAAKKKLRLFLNEKLARYAETGNSPDDNSRSGLSPYLHFGHISAHELFHELMQQLDWSPKKLSNDAKGKRSGWWNAGMNAEAWLDEFITWRELGYNMSSKQDDYDQYDSLPSWAQETLADHADDRREHTYSLREFAAAQTHDPVWNAAQTELVREGRIHNYLRMLWGKKILEWTPSPRDALKILIELNNRYAVDGRDPNSYSGIFWVLGRYDRAWGPERPIFGKVRYMSSESTQRKLKLSDYLKRFGGN